MILEHFNSIYFTPPPLDLYVLVYILIFLTLGGHGSVVFYSLMLLNSLKPTFALLFLSSCSYTLLSYIIFLLLKEHPVVFISGKQS